MSQQQKTYNVKHIETATVKASNKEEAHNKAVEGDTESGWNTKEIKIQETT